MQKSHKIILGSLLGVLTIANVWSILHGSSNLNAIQNNITTSQRHLDTAISQIGDARTKVDSLDIKLREFKDYADKVQDKVDQINLAKNEADSKSLKILNNLRQNASSAREELEKTDSVPPVITIKSL